MFKINSRDRLRSQDGPQTGRAEVKLNVYDLVSMSSLNNWLSSLGCFHSGLQVYDSEFAYGGHNNPLSGVFEIAPRDVDMLGRENFRFRETILLGYTDFNPEDVKQIVDQLGEKFRGDKYSLFRQNCNHFTNSLSLILCGKEIPSWVNRLATVSNFLVLPERILSKYIPVSPNQEEPEE